MNQELMERLNLERVNAGCPLHPHAVAFIRPGADPQCPECFRPIMEKQERYRAIEEHQKQLERISGIPHKYKEAGFRNFEETSQNIRPAKGAIVGYLKQTRETMRAWAPLVLAGPPGTGKTHLLCALANNLISRGIGCHYTTAQAMMQNIKSAYGKEKTGISESERIWSYVGNYSLLIVDEVDMIRDTETEAGLLYAVMNGRYNEERRVAIATNQAPEELGQFLTPRVASRLMENSTIVRCNWPDYRMR